MRGVEAQRRNLRVQGYDYSQYGPYFVTICTQKKRCLFGQVDEGKMVLNQAGQLLKSWWEKLPGKFPGIELDQFAIMPNHFHGIIAIPGIHHVGADPCVGPDSSIQRGEPAGSPLPKIIQWFKTMTTNAYLQKVKNNGWPPFPGKLWQRNYYEHIVRTEEELGRIREYIFYNPAKWAIDRENPGRKKLGPAARHLENYSEWEV